MSYKIGIVAQEHGDSKFGVNKNYLQFIYNAGGIPLMIPPVTMEEFNDFFSKLDALVLPGGMDVNPKRYNGVVGLYTGNYNQYLEHFDTTVLPNILGKLPIFGICRGLQTLNVVFGGTLKQHIWGHPYSQYDEHDVHGVKEPFAKKNKFKVNSFHHQAIGKLALNFEPVLISEYDEIIEAIQDTEKKIFAVQWHPERLRDDYSLNKFKELLK